MRTVGLLLLSFVATACSSSSSGGSTPPVHCNDNPWECPASQTCAPSTTTTYACLNAGPGMAGGTCQNVVGQPECGAALACLQLSGTTAGTCVPYCSTTDPNHACTGGAVCQVVQITSGGNGPTFSVCVSSSMLGDAGSDTGITDDSGTGTDSGTGVDSGTSVDSGTATDSSAD